jgi:dTDP-4-dehydrorhamnose 3,5-epimerase-like enzyme
MNNIKILNFNIIGDERGSLVAIEQLKDIPFEIKRIYYTWGTEKEFVRGKHAHTQLEQVLICVSGSCKIRLDNGKEKQIVELKDKNQGLLIGTMIWREMFDFSEDCVLLVLASEYYDEKEYIRDYNEFLEKVKNGKN